MSYLIDGLRASGLDSRILCAAFEADYGHAAGCIAGAAPEGESSVESLIVDHTATSWKELRATLEALIGAQGARQVVWADEVPQGSATLTYRLDTFGD